MKSILILALLFAPDSSMLALSGAAAMEELDETQVELYQSLAARPININTSNRSRLSGSGLFTPFQIASLLEYRSESGDILSLEELSAVDGFNESIVKMLRPYISVESTAQAGTSSLKNDSSGTLSSRLWFKQDEADYWSYAAKFRYETSRYSAAVALKQPWKEGFILPETINWSAAYYGRRHLERIIVGDFNARFGQGLTLWSGFALSSLSSIQSFYRKSSGLSPSFSYTESGLKGVAADVSFGRITFSGALTFPKAGKGSAVILAANWYGRFGQIGLSATRSDAGKLAAGADSRWSFGKLDIFSEAAFLQGNGGLCAIAGAVWNQDYDLKYVARALYSTQEKKLAAGAQIRKVFFSAEASDKPSSRLKYQASAPLSLTQKLTITLRLSGKLGEDSTKTQGRATIDWVSGPWKASARAEALYGRGFACLLYLEPGFAVEKFSAYVRGTLFAVDYWDDRIYAYERDAPGTFNMKAYYGRGGALSAVAGMKIKRQKLHLRFCLIESDRISRFETHLQYSLDF